MSATALLLIAHGSRHQPANDDLRQMAARIAERGDHAIVEASFLELASPTIPDGGDRCVERGAACVLMVPYFLSAGVHLLRDLTAARDELAARHPGVEFRLGRPLGPDTLLEELVLRRAAELDQPGSAPNYAPASEMAGRYAPMGDHAAG